MKWMLIIFMSASMVCGQDDGQQIPPNLAWLFMPEGLITKGRCNNHAVLSLPIATVGTWTINSYGVIANSAAQYVTYPAGSVKTLARDFSAAFWVYDNTAPSVRCDYFEAGRWDFDSGTFQVMKLPNNGVWFAYSTGSGSSERSIKTAIYNQSAWTHYAGVFEYSSRSWVFYVNGVRDYNATSYSAGAPTTVTINQALPVVLAGSIFGNNLPTQSAPLAGLGLSCMAYRKFTQAEVWQLYQYGLGRYKK